MCVVCSTTIGGRVKVVTVAALDGLVLHTDTAYREYLADTYMCTAILGRRIEASR